MGYNHGSGHITSKGRKYGTIDISPCRPKSGSHNLTYHWSHGFVQHGGLEDYDCFIGDLLCSLSLSLCVCIYMYICSRVPGPHPPPPNPPMVSPPPPSPASYIYIYIHNRYIYKYGGYIPATCSDLCINGSWLFAAFCFGVWGVVQLRVKSWGRAKPCLEILLS